MNQHSVRAKNWFPLLLLLCLVIVTISLLSACTRTNREPAIVSSTATGESTELTSTDTPDLQGTNTPNYQEVFDNRVAQHRASPATEIAQTPKPPYIPFELRTQSPEPATSTPAPWTTGFVDCGIDMRAGGAVRTNNNCW